MTRRDFLGGAAAMAAAGCVSSGSLVKNAAGSAALGIAWGTVPISDTKGCNLPGTIHLGEHQP